MRPFRLPCPACPCSSFFTADACAVPHAWTSTILNNKEHTTCFQRVLDASARFIRYFWSGGSFRHASPSEVTAWHAWLIAIGTTLAARVHLGFVHA